MRGFLILRDYHRDVEDTRGWIDVGYVQKDENNQPFGVQFENVNKAVEYVHGDKMQDQEKIDQLETLFHDISQAKAGNVTHPLYAHGIYEAAFLMGSAIWNRRIKSDFFESSNP